MSYYGDVFKKPDDWDKDFATSAYKFCTEPKKDVKVSHEQKYGNPKG